MDLIYTNAARVDQGVLQDYELDLAFGADENNLECCVQAGSHCCESGSLLYMEGTEYGGIIDSIESKTDSKEVIYTGRTWHGILNSKVIQPDSGAAYLVLTGEANAVIADLLSRLALTDLFEASSEDSGLNIKNYKMNRYISGYDGILKMLKTVGGKLKLTFSGGKVVLSAAAVHDYTQDEEFDADQVPFRAKRNYKGVNHLICLGSGQLEERMVVHLYADKDGNISQEQTQFGLDEVCTIFEYSNIETEEELIQEGMEKFESLMASDEIAIDFDADSDTFDVGDIIGAVDNITGLSAYTTIAKKIVTIKNGKITISLSPDTAKAGSSKELGGGNGGISGGVESFNGREGAVVPAAGDYTAEMVGAVPVGAYSRKNLLHNWFFGNPVNQRGKTEYPAGVFCVDRWKTYAQPFQIKDGYIGTKSGGLLTQVLESPSLFYGKTLTASVLYADGTLVEGTAVYSSSGTAVFVGVGDPTGQVYLSRDGWFQFYQNKGVDYGVVAAKLEIGEGQTLAHQENGVWVLNEIPDFAKQFANCQRYYFTGIMRYTYDSAADGGYYYAPMSNFPVTMRTAPELTHTSLAGTLAHLSRFDGTGEVLIYQAYASDVNSPAMLRLSGNAQQVYYCTVIADAEIK